MIRIIFTLLFIIFNIIPTIAETTDTTMEKDVNAIHETYKIRGQIQYDDNAVETIYLDENIEKPQINIQKKTLVIPTNILNITSNANTSRSALARAMTNRYSVMSDILPLSATIADNVGGGFSYGQTWGQELSHSQMEDTTAFFIKYETPRWFSLTNSIRQATNQDIGTQYNSIRISPELHITERLTIKDSFSSYMNLPKNKNEITLVYTPALTKYADCLKFELGIAQSYYKTGKQSASMSFSTGFKL